jgi:ABC-type sugar transport system ATPase subunit
MIATAVSLDIREASVFYGAHRVLDRVSLSAAGGEFIALLGASGCGKTTLLRAICGFVGLASGSIIVGGQDVTHLSPEKRNIAMVFQSYALWPHMTVAQNIGYGLKSGVVWLARGAMGRRLDRCSGSGHNRGSAASRNRGADRGACGTARGRSRSAISARPCGRRWKHSKSRETRAHCRREPSAAAAHRMHWR